MNGSINKEGKSIIRVDMWYGNATSEATRLNIFWADLDCVYRGNVFIGDKYAGDYTANSVQEIQKKFPQLINT